MTELLIACKIVLITLGSIIAVWVVYGLMSWKMRCDYRKSKGL